VRYTIEETYIYEVEADTPELARECFQEFMEANTKDDEEYTGVKFCENKLNTYDSTGKEV
jgi:hypothetical protein